MPVVYLRLPARFQTIIRVPWSSRSVYCKLGLHYYGQVTPDDIESASQVCRDCNKITHHNKRFVAACIRNRHNKILVRRYGK